MTISDFGNFIAEPIDMSTLILIGNAGTRIDASGRMVTPRGYAVRSEYPRSSSTDGRWDT